MVSSQLNIERNSEPNFNKYPALDCTDIQLEDSLEQKAKYLFLRNDEKEEKVVVYPHDG